MLAAMTTVNPSQRKVVKRLCSYKSHDTYTNSLLFSSTTKSEDNAIVAVRSFTYLLVCAEDYSKNYKWIGTNFSG